MKLTIEKLVKYAADSYTDIVKPNQIRLERKNLFVKITHLDVDSVVVAVRGTDDGLDWFHNLARWKTNFDRGRVHSGFLNHTDLIYKDVISQVKDKRNINITGHSLGGAVSLLIGARLALSDLNVSVQVTTFGSPRVGNCVFRNWCNKQKNLHVRRIHNKKDPVTYFPIVGYRHVGENYTVYSSNKWWRFLKSHSITTYKSCYVKVPIECL